MSDDKGHNGYANYETWAVALWMDNDQGWYESAREDARRIRDEATECEQVREGIWTVEQAAKFNLADLLKEQLDSCHPFHGDHVENPPEPNVFHDLLNAAISEIDWHEIAEHVLSELD